MQAVYAVIYSFVAPVFSFRHGLFLDVLAVGLYCIFVPAAIIKQLCSALKVSSVSQTEKSCC